MKPLVIYHADCTDGYGAAFAAWLKLGDEAEYLPMNYGENPIVLSNINQREVYILDFSFPRHIMDDLFRDAKRVVWLDHHKTAFEMWIGGKFDGTEGDHHQEDQVRYITLSQSKSGALLAWEYFHPGTEVPMLIQHIDDRDRWQWELEGSAEIHAALGSMQPWTFEQWVNEIGAGDAFPSHDLYDQGAAILRAQKQHVERMAKQAMKCVIRWHDGEVDGQPAVNAFSGLAVNASLHQSEVGHELANVSGTFGLVWCLGDDNTVRCSLRSNGDYDVSAIALAFDGGGHRNAAGFSTDIETLMGWLK